MFICDGFFIIPEDNKRAVIPSDRPQLDETIIPIFYQSIKVSQQLLDKFNLDPLENYNALFASLSKSYDPPPEMIAMFLFFSEVSPHAISILFYKVKLFSDSFPLIFFRSPVINMMPFTKALDILLSRVAIPFYQDDFILFINTIGSVLQESGFFKRTSLTSICNLVICAIFHSFSTLIGQSLSLDTFLRVCYSKPDLDVLGDETLTAIFNELNLNPLHLSYSFFDHRYPPNPSMSGILQIKSAMKKFKDVYATISKGQFLYYNDKSGKQLLGGLPLNNVTFASPIINNKPLSFGIVSITNEQFGYKVEHGKHIASDKFAHIFYSNSKEDLEHWRGSIMRFEFADLLNRSRFTFD